MAKKILVNLDFNKNQILNAVIQVLASAPGTPTAGQIYYNSTDNNFYGYNGTIWVNLSNLLGATDLSFSRDGTTVTVESSTGNNAILPAATNALAGVMSATDKDKLDGIAANANNYIHPNHTGDVTSVADGATTIVADAVTTAKIINDAVTNAKLANVASSTIKGRVTAATGNPEDLTPAQVRTLLNVADGANNYTHPNHTGDVTSAGDGVQTIVDNAVSNAKLANMTTARIKGRVTAAAGDPEDLTASQVRTLLNVEDGADVTDATNVNAAGATMNADTTLVGNGYFLDDNTMSANDDTKVASQQSIVAYVATEIGSAIAGGFTFKGEYNAATNTPNLDVTPIGGILQGDVYVISSAGDFFAEAVQVGDMIIAKQDTPTTLAHWALVNKNIPDIVSASETAEGIVERATQAEVDAGSDTTRYVSPDTLQAKIDALSFGTTNKYTGTIGNGSATSIAVTHGLGSQYVIARIFDATSNEEVECEVVLTSSTQTTFNFNVAPTTNQYRVVIVG